MNKIPNSKCRDRTCPCSRTAVKAVPIFKVLNFYYSSFEFVWDLEFQRGFSITIKE